MSDLNPTCYIYTLHASNDPERRPRYVGFTCRLKRREIEHNNARELGRKNVWVLQLKSLGEKAVLTVVHTFASSDTLEREIVEAEWIENYRNNYPDLLNDLGGGGGVAPCSPELRAKRKLMNLGRVHTMEEREKVRLSKLGKKRPREVIEKLRQANLGRKLSPEHIEKIRQRMLAYRHSPEARLKISLANKGRKMSAESKEKWRQKMVGRKLSESHKRNIALAGIGRKATPESIAKTRAKLRGQKRTPEQCERIRQGALSRNTHAR